MTIFSSVMSLSVIYSDHIDYKWTKDSDMHHTRSQMTNDISTCVLYSDWWFLSSGKFDHDQILSSQLKLFFHSKKQKKNALPETERHWSQQRQQTWTFFSFLINWTVAQIYLQWMKRKMSSWSMLWFQREKNHFWFHSQNFICKTVFLSFIIRSSG